MAMGTWSEEPVQGELFITSGDLPRSMGHPFYAKLNSLLDEAGFDRFVESQCVGFYDAGVAGGRPSLPPGTYFRMLFVGFFEGIDSQRGIAWRCADSLALREFLGLAWNEASPDHSSLTRIRQRLDAGVHDAVFEWVLTLCAAKKLLTDPKVVGVDSTTLEANAAMRSIVRKGSGESYQEYLKRLMKDEGVDDPTDEDLRRFDKKRKKKCSNAEWESKSDPAARIAKMKDGRTHLAYKAEHVVDLDSEVILAAEIYPADVSDKTTLTDSVMTARCHLTEAGLQKLTLDAAATDKGYHAREQLALAACFSVRTYVAEPVRKYRNDWTNSPAEQQDAVYANRRRVKGSHGRALQRLRSEKVERSFAHLCETGGSRRSWLRGFPRVRKRYTIAAAARNLGLLMRRLFGMGKPRTQQPEGPPAGNGPQSPESFLRQLIRRLQLPFHATFGPYEVGGCPIAA
jgi:transposase